MNRTRVLKLSKGRWSGLSLLVVGALALGASACSSPSTASTGTTGGSGGSKSYTVNLVAYSTPKKAYAKLIAAFQKTPAGKNVTFTTSFAASGQQAKNVIAGQPADVVNFSLEPDMAKVVKAGLVSPSWDTVGPAQGIVTDSVVAFIVRKGNPKHITTWADLIKPGVKVVTPNPFSSGSARWNLMASYGAELKLGKSPTQAQAYLTSLLKNTVAQPASASDALAAFEAGTGDVLLDYEDDAIAAVKKSSAVQYLDPPQTILIQNPIAVTTSGAKNKGATAFVSYLLSPAGQEEWAKLGYRPVIASATAAAGVHFQTPQVVFTINSLGGWTSVVAKFFDPTTGIVAKIESGLGVSTASS